MADQTQNLANHTRFHPPFHFIMFPLLMVHFVNSAYVLWKNPGWPALEGLLFAIGVLVAGFLTRIYGLKVQDRVIRLEERLRYQAVLPADLAAKASALDVKQIVALRFASDAELAPLVTSIVSGKLTESKEIKQAIKDWRGDYHRV